MMLTYEPVWAIGSGRTATPDDASAIHEVLRAALSERLGEKARQGNPISYGVWHQLPSATLAITK